MCRFVQCADAELQSDHHSRECQAGSAQAAVATAHPEPPDVMKLSAGGGGRSWCSRAVGRPQWSVGADQSEGDEPVDWRWCQQE